MRPHAQAMPMNEYRGSEMSTEVAISYLESSSPTAHASLTSSRPLVMWNEDAGYEGAEVVVDQSLWTKIVDRIRK